MLLERQRKFWQFKNDEFGVNEDVRRATENNQKKYLEL